MEQFRRCLNGLFGAIPVDQIEFFLVVASQEVPAIGGERSCTVDRCHQRAEVVDTVVFDVVDRRLSFGDQQFRAIG